ncbi:hypothetical protein [Actinomadura sp. KC06]|uniref:hypothetical protein n=1 Tax=Actinomadura sp. KC06 TaxID=2530369 RepID=UPI001A9E5A5B|nr:hypothetical protein [Actinomadura sp. KC06]
MRSNVLHFLEMGWILELSRRSAKGRPSRSDRRVIVSNRRSQRIPENRARGELTAEDMSRVTADDFAELGRIARAYCRTVDYTRSRKRMDGSATMVRNGIGKYGTDDVSDDTTQDAVLIFAKRLAKIITTCAVASVESGEQAWKYVKRNGETIIVTRNTLHYWAVRDAAARNGYRLDVPADELDETPGFQLMRGIPHADTVASLAVVPYVAGYSATIFRSAWGDGSDFPTLRRIMDYASQADDLGRAGILTKTAQSLYGGPRNSSSKVRRTSDAARKEWRKLSARLDETRDEMIYESVRAKQTK